MIMPGNLQRLLDKAPPLSYIEAKMREKEYARWLHAGKPMPPPHVVKQRVIESYAAKFKIKTFVETGTYLGDMVHAVKRDFAQIYSIELSARLFARAQARFRSESHINLIQGDSGSKMPFVLSGLKSPVLFWLDGHYSGGITARGDDDSPISGELEAIFALGERGHVILIDDARCFTGKNGYPTLDQLFSFVRTRLPSYVVSAEHDIVRATPSENAGP